MSHLCADSPDVLRDYLLDALTKLRLEFARRFKAERALFPNAKLPCDTCAFRTSTDAWHGFELTVIHFVAALATGTPFYCHHDFRIDRKTGKYIIPKRRVDGVKVPDERRMHLCAAWGAFQMVDDPLDPPFDVRTVMDPLMVDVLVGVAEREAVGR